MTFSSSDGWPLNGPKRRVRREPAVSVPKHEHEQQEDDPDRSPGVLVAAEPRVRADHDADGRGDADGEHQPDQLDLAQPQGPAADVVGHQVLGQALHQEQRDPAEHPHRRQQDLVGPTPGEDLGEVGEGERAEVHGQPDRVEQGDLAGHRQAERQAADEQGHRDGDEQLRLGPARPRPDRPEDAGSGSRPRRRARGARRHRSPPRGRSSRSRTWPIPTSSPNPSGDGPWIERPLRAVPFVLPASSTYQLRPR